MLLAELKAFRASIIQPACKLVKEDIRNINLLSLRDESIEATSFDKSEPAKVDEAPDKEIHTTDVAKPPKKEEPDKRLNLLRDPEETKDESRSLLVEYPSLPEANISKLSALRSVDGSMSMQVSIDYDFIKRVEAYLNQRRLGHAKY